MPNTVNIMIPTSQNEGVICIALFDFDIAEFRKVILWVINKIILQSNTVCYAIFKKNPNKIVVQASVKNFF